MLVPHFIERLPGTHFGRNFFKPEYKKNPFCCVQKGFL